MLDSISMLDSILSSSGGGIHRREEDIVRLGKRGGESPTGKNVCVEEDSRAVMVHTLTGRRGWPRAGEGIQKEAMFGHYRGTWAGLRNEGVWEPRLPPPGSHCK